VDVPILTFFIVQLLIMLNPYFVTGLTEGEGSFTYSRVSVDQRRLSLVFALSLTKDDYGLILSLREFFGFGRIYWFGSRKTTEHSGNTRAKRFYRVTRMLDLYRLMKHFDTYPLQGHKGKVYEAWKDVLFYKSRTSLSRIDPQKLELLLAKLSILTNKGRRSVKDHARAVLGR